MADNNPRKQPAANGTVPLTDILYRTLHYWPWVLMSVIICVGASVIYLLRTPDVYTQSASLLIKDETKGASAGTDDFGDFGLFSNKTNIHNEITALKSPDLMEEVVRRLHLDMNYYLPGRFHKIVAYGSTLPVQVSMPDCPDNSSASFNLSVDTQGRVSISDMRLQTGQETARKYQGALNDSIATVAGPVIVTPTPFYDSSEATDLYVVKSPLASMVASYGNRLSVGMSNDKGTVIDLTLSDLNIQRADEVLSTIIGVYNENWIRDKNQIAVSTSNFINDRLRVIEGELGNVDSDISSFKSANLVPDVSAAASSYMAESQNLAQELLTINNQLQTTRYIRNYLSADAGNDRILPSNTGIDNPGIQEMISEYNTRLLERNNLLSKSSEKNPLVKNLDKELSEMRGAIIASVDNAIVNMQTQIKGLQGARGAATSKLATNPNQAKYLLSVERQQKVKESLYLFLLQKREDNELNQAFTAYNSRVIRKPGGSTAPTAPNKRNILIISFIIGLAIPFAVIYLKETNNTKLRGRKDVENLALPFLGEIPQNGNGHGNRKSKEQHEKNSIVVKEGKRNIINEAFRILRTNVEFMCNSADSHTLIAITSFNPGSGKSFICVNLGMSIALKGKRVLVIDGDMRHGSTSSYVGSPAQGLSNYLSVPGTDVSQLIITSPECPTFGILPIGAIPPNPTELLESPRFAQLLQQLKSQYDFIIIDCPPIEVVADAQIIDKSVDRTFFVIRAGLLERSMLPELDRLYEEKKYRNMAFILNGTRNDQGRYGYSHSYKYGYGYGYGYGYNYGDGKKNK